MRLHLPQARVPAVFAASQLLLCSAVSGAIYQLDFDFDEDGDALVAGSTNLAASPPYENLFAPGVGVTLTVSSAGGRPLNLYDTEGTGGADDDMERNSEGTGEWAGGNAPTLVVNNALIVNTNSTIGTPNDWAGGGTITMSFDRALTSFGFDQVDLDSSANGTLVFTDRSTSQSASVPFSAFEDGSGSIHETAGVLFGNRHANSIRDITATELGLTSFDQVQFVKTSSGGIATLFVDTVNSVPEPSVFLLGALGLAPLLRRRRRG